MSPYDLAMLKADFPDVYGAYVDLCFDAIEERGRQAKKAERQARVNRIFQRGK